MAKTTQPTKPTAASNTATTTGNHITVKPSQLIEVLRLCDAATLTPFVLSPPGIGKSDIFRQYAKLSNRRFIDTRLSYCAPTDVKGFPRIDFEADKMRFAVPEDYPEEGGNVWLLDEFSCASKMVQNAALQLVLDKMVGKYEVPENTLLALAGNGAGHRVHVERLSAAVANRIMFIHLTPDLDDWTRWAVENSVDVRVIAFIRFRPDLLHTFNPATWDGESGFGSPRSWAMAARLVAQNPPVSLRMPMIEGLVGQGPGAELHAFLSLYEQLPNVDSILRAPAKADVPTEPSTRYALCAAIVNRLNKDNFAAALEYLQRLPKEFEVFAVQSAFRVKPEIALTKEFTHWVIGNPEIFGNEMLKK